jgi:hypothetical protein
MKSKPNVIAPRRRDRVSLHLPPSDEIASRTTIHSVQLEAINVLDHVVHGLVRVLNLALSKRVVIRYTLDSWHSFHDVDASFHRSVSSKIPRRLAAAASRPLKTSSPSPSSSRARAISNSASVTM